MSGVRVAVTGLGIISSIGNSLEEAEASLKSGQSGVRFAPSYAERGFRSQVEGAIRADPSAEIDRRTLRFMGDGAAYAFMAARQAIQDAGLEEAEVAGERTGLVAGSGGPSTSNQIEAARILAETGSPRRMGPYMVPRCMSSTVSANLATALKLRGPQLLALLGLLHERPLHPHCRQLHPQRRARHHARRRRRGAALEPLHAL